jgi:tetratricopeptide (TPR) repeat protein
VTPRRSRRFGTAALLLYLGSLLLLAGNQAAHAKERPWIELKSRNFLAISNAEQEEAVALIRDLELFRSVVLKITNTRVYEARVPTIIYLFGDRGSYASFRLSRNVAGYAVLKAHGNYIAIDGSSKTLEASNIVHHEYVHFLVRNAGGFHYPLWYEEGFAEFLSTVEVDGDQVMIGNIPALRAQLLSNARLIPFETVTSARSYDDLSSKSRAMFYAQSWLLVHYLVTGDLYKDGIEKPRLPELIRYLELVNQGLESSEAIEQAFEGGEKGLLEGVRKHRRRRRFRRLAIPVSSLPPVEEPTVRRMAGSEVSRYLGELALQLGPEHQEQALDLFERAVRDAPDDARALAGLGTALAFEGRQSEAQQALTRAVAIAPEDSRVHLALADHLAARADSEREQLEPDERRALRAKARMHYLTCISLEPTLPAAHFGLGATYHGQGGNLSPGIAALETAHAQLRGSTSISLELAELYAAAGAFEKARLLLEEVMRWSRGDENIEAARALLNGLDALAAEEAAAGESNAAPR